MIRPGSLLSSLRGRIFLASAMLAVLSIGVAIYLVNVRVTREAEATLQREMVAAAALVNQLRTTRAETFSQMARLIADAPKVKAAVDTNDPPTVQDVASEYQDQLKSNLLLVTNKTGAVLATVAATPRAEVGAATRPAIQQALKGRESFSLLAVSDGMLQLVTVPITIGLTQPEILGTVSVGFLLDNSLAAQLKEITGSDVAFGMNGDILAATMPRDVYALLAERLQTSGISRLTLAGEDYLLLPLTLDAPASADGVDGPLQATSDTPGPAPKALILRSQSELLRGLQAIHTGLAVTAVLAVLLATVLSFAIARTITLPLANITGVMREVAATGDLTRKIAVRHGRHWDDEDARLLATSFNTLTDSIARFQRQMSQKERLTSLGRLSTVIAHEIRNPLMIIKASLHALRQGEPSQVALQEAVSDIEEEVSRLNRIVNEVLDFSRPIRFDLAPADIGVLCRESAAAAQASPGQPVTVEVDDDLPTLVIDAERLRAALVNLLVNARHATNDDSRTDVAAGASPTDPAVLLKASGTRDRVTITVTDRGIGISPADLSHVFDPYFTTKRGGTGLGLPIAKNIVEGLGGTINVVSGAGEGTEIRIEFPVPTPAAASE